MKYIYISINKTWKLYLDKLNYSLELEEEIYMYIKPHI